MDNNLQQLMGCRGSILRLGPSNKWIVVCEAAEIQSFGTALCVKNAVSSGPGEEFIISSGTDLCPNDGEFSTWAGV